MHLAFTWDSVTGTMRMYRNGQLVASRLGASWTTGTLSANIETVRTYAGDHGIQDFAIIGRALTIDEVQSIYLANAPLSVRQSNYELTLADAGSSEYRPSSSTAVPPWSRRARGAQSRPVVADPHRGYGHRPDRYSGPRLRYRRSGLPRRASNSRILLLLET